MAPRSVAPKAVPLVEAKKEHAVDPPPRRHGDTRDEDRDRDHPERDDRALEALDPAARQAACLAPPPGAVARPAPVAPAMEEGAVRRMSMEELLPMLVRRIAWSGDRHRGTVRLEIGAGAYEGAMLVVHSDAGRVRVEVSGAGDLDALRKNLDARLRRHGLDVESVT